MFVEDQNLWALFLLTIIVGILGTCVAFAFFAYHLFKEKDDEFLDIKHTRDYDEKI